MQSQMVIEGWRGVATEMGLWHPIQRGVTATVISGAILYGMKYPKHSFRENGSVKPFSSLTTDPSAITWQQHFILIPLLVGGVTALCT